MKDGFCRVQAERTVLETEYARLIESYYRETLTCPYCGAVKHRDVYSERHWVLDTPALNEKDVE